MSALILLFVAGRLAATLLPLSSELLLLALLHQGHAPLAVWLAATLGNVLGALINWYLGGYLCRFVDRRWFPVSAAQLESARRRFQRLGLWSLLLAWVPVIGDPLTVLAGVLRVPVNVFMTLMLLAKGGRYALVIFLAVWGWQ